MFPAGAAAIGAAASALRLAPMPPMPPIIPKPPERRPSMARSSSMPSATATIQPKAPRSFIALSSGQPKLAKWRSRLEKVRGECERFQLQ